MNVAPTIDRTFDARAYLEWALNNPETRTELLEGEIVWMSPETNLHSKVKALVTTAFVNAVRQSRTGAEVYTDGSSVKVDEKTVFVPDLVLQSAPSDDREFLLESPVVVVEIISPNSRGIDTNRKLLGYFRVPSVAHYLVVDPVDRSVIHFRRSEDGGVRSTLVTDTTLILDPPGLEIAVADLFPD